MLLRFFFFEIREGVEGGALNDADRQQAERDRQAP
jgi:hypothetical protein